MLISKQVICEKNNGIFISGPYNCLGVPSGGQFVIAATKENIPFFPVKWICKMLVTSIKAKLR